MDDYVTFQATELKHITFQCCRKICMLKTRYYTVQLYPNVKVYASYSVKSVQIWSFFWSVFSLHTPYLSVCSLNAGKYGPEKTPYFDTFHTVTGILNCNYLLWTFISNTLKVLKVFKSPTLSITLRKKCPYSELVWSAFSRIVWVTLTGVVLVSLLLTLNIFHTLFKCFYC